MGRRADQAWSGNYISPVECNQKEIPEIYIFYHCLPELAATNSEARINNQSCWGK